MVMLEHLGGDEPDAQSAKGAAYRSALRRFQRDIVREALKRSNGNVAEAARTLGIARSYLHALMRRLDLSPSSLGSSAVAEPNGYGIGRKNDSERRRGKPTRRATRSGVQLRGVEAASSLVETA